MIDEGGASLRARGGFFRAVCQLVVGKGIVLAAFDAHGGRASTLGTAVRHEAPCDEAVARVLHQKARAVAVVIVCRLAYTRTVYTVKNFFARVGLRGFPADFHQRDRAEYLTEFILCRVRRCEVFASHRDRYPL